MDEIFIKWQTMWDAKEFTTQLFFLLNLVFAGYVASIPLRSSHREITSVARGLMIVFGIGYATLTVYGYFQLVPTFSPYE